MNIGDKIRKLRSSQGLKQIDVAKATGASRPSVTDWENSVNRPKSQYIMPLAKLLNVDIYWLLDDKRDDEPPEYGRNT